MQNRCAGASRKVALEADNTDRTGFAMTVTCPTCAKTLRRDRWSSLTGIAIVPFHKSTEA